MKNAFIQPSKTPSLNSRKVTHLQNCDSPNPAMHSEVIDEVLRLTYPNFQKLFPFKKEEFYHLIFKYFFMDDEKKFYEIEAFSNLITACNLKGYKVAIQNNGINSFAAFDQYMLTKKAKSFALVSQLLDKHEVLDEKEKNEIVGGKESEEHSMMKYYFNIYLSKIA